jgi:uncharacterized protein YheU (UPF0270 family)
MHDPDAPRDEDDDEPVEVPFERLSAGALRGLVEEFVTRDGTDYGVREASLEAKVAAVLRQVEKREVRIFFDPKTRTTNLVPGADVARPRRRDR